MPISHKHKCIFVHIPKCAGTSIEHALGMHGPNEEIGIKPFIHTCTDQEHLFGKGAQHYTIQEIRSIIYPEVFDSYFKFGMVRNPWDRLVSHFAWRGRKWTDGINLEKKQFNTQLLQFYKSVVSGKEYPIHLKQQWEFLYDDENKLLVDYIGRVENLQVDWAEICDQLGISLPLENRMTSYHKHYSYYYNILTKWIVYLLYHKDIKLFGYTI